MRSMWCSRRSETRPNLLKFRWTDERTANNTKAIKRRGRSSLTCLRLAPAAVAQSLLTMGNFTACVQKYTFHNCGSVRLLPTVRTHFLVCHLHPLCYGNREGGVCMEVINVRNTQQQSVCGKQEGEIAPKLLRKAENTQRSPPSEARVTSEVPRGLFQKLCSLLPGLNLKLSQ